MAGQVGLPEEATTLVLDAITLHHSPGVGPEHGAVAQLLSAGAAVDFIGLHAWQLPDAVLADAVTLHPREDFKNIFIGAFGTEAKRGAGRDYSANGASRIAVAKAP